MNSTQIKMLGRALDNNQTAADLWDKYRDQVAKGLEGGWASWRLLANYLRVQRTPDAWDLYEGALEIDYALNTKT